MCLRSHQLGARVGCACDVLCVVLQEQGVDEAPASLYYEPHCDFDQSSVAKVGPVDVVVSPVQSVLLGG
jgi:hypothetical protein